MSEDVQQSEGSVQVGGEGSLKGEDVALRQRRQKAYRARQREVAVLLGKLWRLRSARETPGKQAWRQPDWEELAALVRRLVHEEELIARSRRPAAKRAGGRPTGLSTDHITPQTPVKGNTPSAPVGSTTQTKKKNGKPRRK